MINAENLQNILKIHELAYAIWDVFLFVRRYLRQYLANGFGIVVVEVLQKFDGLID